MHQSAGSQLEKKLHVENRDDLRNRGADEVMQKRTQHNRTMPNRRVGHDRLDDFAALGTVILLNRMLGDFGFDVVGDVFGVTFASRAACSTCRRNPGNTWQRA